MADLDVKFAGGASGAMTRAAQLEALRASNAQAAAARLLRPKAPPPTAPPRPAAGSRYPTVPMQRDRSFADWRENRPEFRRPSTAPGDLVGALELDDQLRDAGNPGVRVDGMPGLTRSVNADDREDRPEFKRPAAPPIIDPVDKERQQHFADYRENAPHVSGVESTSAKSVNHTIQGMVDDVKNDPMADSGRLLAVQEMADAFRDKSKFRFFTPDELADNPLIRAINDVSVWSRYRKMVSEWHDRKRKVGETNGSGTAEDAGDGTFVGLIDNGSFGSEKSPSALPPYVVARDENGLLTVIKAAQWYQGKFTDMKKDPKFAAFLITGLAQTSLYGSDTTANAQASRVAVDKNGNPVKAVPGVEDLNALAALANQAVIWQNNGDETSIDDTLAELVVLGQDVLARNKANGEQGGGSGGDGGGGGRGFGGGGGGGGGSSAVRYTDPEQLKSLVDSIGRQRMGRSLTPEEQALFVQHFHQLEASNYAAFQAGQSFMQIDPEGQAVAWIQNHFQKANEANQYGELAAEFFALMQGSNPFGGISN